MKQPHAFLDIETTGLDPLVNEPLEVAYILMPEAITVHYSLSVDLDRASEVALQVNGYGIRSFPDPWKAFYAWKRLEQDLKDRVIIGNNVRFDLEFLVEFMRRTDPERGYHTPWQHHPVDVKALVGGALQLAPPWHTETIEERLGVRPPERVIYPEHPCYKCKGMGLESVQEGNADRLTDNPCRPCSGTGQARYHTALADAQWNRRAFEALDLFEA
jgi:hypothetical protein